MSSRSLQSFKSQLQVALNRELGGGASLGVGKEYTIDSLNFYYDYSVL